MSASPDASVGSSPAAVPDVPVEELRLAVVLNGGVSLAVWMGGATYELNRLTYSDPNLAGNGSPYVGLLDLAKSVVRADVIAGTSAGGINGAALAVAQANTKADLLTLRDLWADQGRMESLLRQPFKGQPASLLDGDEYFLPQLNHAMRGLISDFQPSERPIDLTITTTVLNGIRTVTVDALSQRIPDRRHDGRFVFRSGAAVGAAAESGKTSRVDAFSESRVGLTADALALAARCSASFPLAFEPTFVPVNTGGTSSGAAGSYRPDMADYAEWGTATAPADEPNRSRYAVDGGVLANTPTQAALEAIKRMPADRPLRRVMLLVHPHAAIDEPDLPDEQSTPPTVTSGLVGLLGALTGQGSRNFVAEVEQHNRLAAGWRGGRIDVLEAANGVADLYTLAQVSWPHFVRLRLRRAAHDLATRIPPFDGWNFERVRVAAEEAQKSWLDAKGSLPYLPERAPPYVPSLPAPEADKKDDKWPWAWGVTVALGVADSVGDLLRRVLSVANDSEVAFLATARKAVSDARTAIESSRRLTDDVWEKDPLRKLPPDHAYWTARLGYYEAAMLGAPAGCKIVTGSILDKLPETDRKDVQSGLDRLAAEQPRRVGDVVARQVDAVVAALQSVRGTVLGIIDDPQRCPCAAVGCWRNVLATDHPVLDEPAGNDDDVDRRRLLMRLLALETATWMVADEPTTGLRLPVDLVQLSLQTANPFTRQTVTGDDKVAGLSINRFGGFLKRSWRINDWIWGRLDAATTLCAIVLEPGRLRRIAVLAQLTTMNDEQRTANAETMVSTLMGTLFNDPEEKDPFDGLRKNAVRELAEVFHPDARISTLPSSLPNLTKLCAWGIHLQIILEELPALACAIRADRVEGANPRSRGEQLLQEHEKLLEQLETTPPQAPGWIDRGKRALEAFDKAGVGREPLLSEASSDQMIRTATTAAAVTVTIVDSGRSGLTVLKPITRTIRGATLLIYWVVAGLTSGSPAARFLALLGLAAGGILLTLSLFGGIPSLAAGPAAALGAGALLAAMGYGALRSGTLLHGVALLGPVLPLVAFALEDAANKGTTSGRAEAATLGITTVVIVFLVVAALVVLGSLPFPVRRPWAALLAALDRSADRATGIVNPVGQLSWSDSRPRRGRRVVTFVRLSVRMLAVLALPTALGLVGWHAWRHRASLKLDIWAIPAALVTTLAAVIIGIVLAARTAHLLKTWRRSPQPPPTWEPVPADHSAAAAASWSIVYGTAYAAAAWLIGLTLLKYITTKPWSILTSLVTCTTFAAALLLVAPVVLLNRHHAALVRSLTAAGTLAGPHTSAANPLVAVLQRRGETYGYLLRPSTPSADLVLTPDGVDLHESLTATEKRPRAKLPISIHLLGCAAALFAALAVGGRRLDVISSLAGWIAVAVAFVAGLAAAAREGWAVTQPNKRQWRGSAGATAIGLATVVLTLALILRLQRGNVDPIVAAASGVGAAIVATTVYVIVATLFRNRILGVQRATRWAANTFRNRQVKPGPSNVKAQDFSATVMSSVDSAQAQEPVDGSDGK